MRSVLLVCAAFASIFLCGFGKIPADSGPAPADYRAQVSQYILISFKDPDSIKNLRISTPYRLRSRTYNGYWAVCIQANARNSYGGYVGLKDYIYIFKGGRIIDQMGGAWANSDLCQAELRPFSVRG
jgi:hypothetical protein